MAALCTGIAPWGIDGCILVRLIIQWQLIVHLAQV